MERTVDARRITFVFLSSLLLFGTLYSVATHSYLDTSDPTIALTHTPHPLHDTQYFARKNNVLNTVFIKRAWGWTSGAALLLLLTSPSPSVTGPGTRQVFMSARERLFKWGAATLVWLLFTAWFFGPSLFSRLTVASGVNASFDYPQAPLAPDSVLFEGDWRTRARLMRGHDVSGHIFLLTMSLLFLADALKPHLNKGKLRSLSQTVVLIFTVLLMNIWFLSVLTTAIYFHTASEKFTGYLLGLAGFLFIQLPFYWDQNIRSRQTSRIRND
ncbi:inositol phospholipid biosynthesis scs3 [Pyrrhoderma noxium]|uniref:Inositol phospholipid biosynthesis scs3 n=1 Tax=Pyrrhoderma noxium TaxID=2282107 RepID=A0A286UL51_9AGAM|nr:inositol phospholipid biosynthesis scs3 [Pyrrhoderma noxium]